jgi:hypothetical protein
LPPCAQFPLPFQGGCGDGIVAKDEKRADHASSLRTWLGFVQRLDSPAFIAHASPPPLRLISKGSVARRPQRRIAETLRIIDSAQERMSKKNQQKSGAAKRIERDQ